MLTPASDDPNRKTVLAEMKKNPKAFGEDIPTATTEPARNLNQLDGGLVPEGGKKAAEDPAPTAEEEAAAKYAAELAAWAEEVLQHSVGTVTEMFPEFTEEHLNALLAAETAGQGRKSLLAAIEDKLNKGE